MEVVVRKVKFEVYDYVFGFRLCLLRISSLDDILRLALNYCKLVEVIGGEKA